MQPEAEMLALVNRYRVSLGLGALTVDDALVYCAVVKLADQIAYHRLSHVEGSGREIRDLMAYCHIPQPTPYAEILGETHYADGQAGEAVTILAAWQASGAHDAILRDPAYVRTGIAAWGWFWVMHLAGRV